MITFDTTTGWTLYDAQGYIQKNGCEVQHYEDGTTRINATLHRTCDFAEISDVRIDFGSWYLERVVQ